jgi:uncharacterized protein
MALEDPRFICDDHCGRLARWLRFVGFDCLHDQKETDAQLLLKAADDNRVILTRDRHLAGKTLARQAILLSSSDPLIQLREVLESSSLTLADGRLLTRCTVCNAPTDIVDITAIWDRIPPYVQRTQTEFRLCGSCNRIYWKGTHVTRMLERLREVGLAL